MSQEKISVEVSAHFAGEMMEKFKDIAETSVRKIEKKNLDGVQTTVLVVQTITPLISALVPILLHYLSRNNTNRIRRGDIEIINPTPQQITELLRG